MKKRILYVSRLIDKKSFTELFADSLTMPGQQGPKYHRLLIKGLLHHNVDVISISGAPVTSENCKKKLIILKRRREDGMLFRYAPTINLPLIRNVCQFLYTLISVVSIGMNKDTVVICDVLQGSISYGASLACRIINKPCIGVVTDLPEMLVTGASDRYVKMVNQILDNCTHYIFLTKYMNTAVNKMKKPYTIVEGISDSSVKTSTNRDLNAINDKLICMYAGMLEEKYGIKALVEAFLLADVHNAELHIYGNGTYSAEIQKVANDNPSIIYHGNVMMEQVVAAEMKASLLINPRPSTEEFTKYSFPSKNMEYMASGTPALITRLPGIPEEYYDYVYSFEDESVTGMARTIKKVLSLSEEQRKELGRNAQRFVKENKNEYDQAKKVIMMLE